MSVKTHYFNIGWNVFTMRSMWCSWWLQNWRLFLIANKQGAGHEVQEGEGPQYFSSFLPRIWIFSDNLFSSCLLHLCFPPACCLSWNTSVTCVLHMWQKWKDPPNDKQTTKHSKSSDIMNSWIDHTPLVLWKQFIFSAILVHTTSPKPIIWGVLPNRSSSCSLRQCVLWHEPCALTTTYCRARAIQRWRKNGDPEGPVTALYTG